MKITWKGLGLGVLLGLSLAPALPAQEPFDLLIRGGRILDGTGNPWFQADVGVRGGRIAAVGRLEGSTARRIVDARGRMVAPGFIDMHSHADDHFAGREPTGLRSPDPRRRAAPNVVAQGVTTVVVNQDGRSFWPIREQRAALERLGAGPNVALMVGHGEVRRQVMGDDFARAATPDEVSRMRALVRQAQEEGAWGLSAGLEYVPGRFSTTDEVAALAAELVPFDGVYISHERSEGSDPMWYWPSQDPAGPPTLLDAVQETIEIGRRSGARVVASHIKAKGAHYWGSSGAAIQSIERARSEGVRVWADQYPYATSGSDGGTVLIPDWVFRAPAREEPDRTAELERALAQESSAAQVRGDIAHEIRRRGGADRVVVSDHPRADFVGKSLAEIATLLGQDPVEAALSLQRLGDPRRPGGGRVRGFSMSEIDVEAYAGRPWVATASDGGISLPEDGPNVHARYYGTFPRKIRHYAIERGVLSVEDAVRSMTSLPARIMGLSDRGMIREGMVADLVVFDLGTIADASTFVEPHQYAQGIEWVVVGGVPVVEAGQLTWALPGRILTRGGGGH
ncbi:MAG: amidohydrolase family protein [Gemmatimonadota bacterium]